jgi:hypothetical protein
MARIGHQLIEESKTAALGSQGIKQSAKKDLLSLLVRANVADSPSQRMTDETVLARKPYTFSFICLTDWHPLRNIYFPNCRS